MIWSQLGYSSSFVPQFAPAVSLQLYPCSCILYRNTKAVSLQLQGNSGVAAASGHSMPNVYRTQVFLGSRPAHPAPPAHLPLHPSRRGRQIPQRRRGGGRRRGPGGAGTRPRPQGLARDPSVKVSVRLASESRRPRLGDRVSVQSRGQKHTFMMFQISYDPLYADKL